jgi:CHAT domain-containing protein
MARGGSINGASDVGQERGNYVEALDLARRAGDRILEADAHNMLGVLETRAGNYRAAEETYLEALGIDREENDPARTARLLSNLGSLHGNIGEYREALQYLVQALPIRKELGGPQQYGNTVYNMGHQHAQLGEYQKALDEYNLALDEFRRATYPYGEAYAFEGLADVSIALHEDAKAEGYLQQGLAARRAIPDRQGEATLLTRLGALAERRGQADEAMRLYRQSLKINQAGGFHAGEVDSRDYIAEALVSKEPRAALDEVTQSIEISRKFGYKQREGFELHVEGLALRRLKDDAGAREAFEKALDIRHSEGAAQQAAQTLLELARLDRDESRPAEAEAHITSAIELIESLRSNIGSRESRMRVATSSRGYYDLAIDVAMKLHEPAKALELSERARARSLLDLLSEAKIDLRQGVDPALLSSERQMQELLDGKHERYMLLLGTSHTAASEAAARKDVDQLVDRYEAIEAEIRARSPRYAALAQARPITVAEIQSQLLNPGTELLEFWLGEDRGYVWMVSKEECRGFELPARAVIEGLAGRAYRALTTRNLPATSSLEEYGKRLAAAKAEFESTSGQLSRILLGPVAPTLRSHKLWIVSDGALQYLPFAALPLPGKASPLVSLYEITALPSASTVAAIRSDLGARPPAKASVAIFADPVFRSDDPRVVAGMRRGGGDAEVTRAAEEAGVADLPRLSFSRAEATAIAALLPPGEAWQQLDFNASLADAKKPELGRYGIVHFATHALLNSRHPELSGIVLSMVDGHGRPQDGFLRLHEIYNLKLRADLVVLSGCQTALGQEVRSEGLVGLTRGFMYAGSPQVLASLWSVRDSATAEFMRRFYEGMLRRHLAPAAALRETQLSIMQDPRWKDPYDWAAFTLQGTR